jgi:hypothetical protein
MWKEAGIHIHTRSGGFDVIRNPGSIDAIEHLFLFSILHANQTPIPPAAIGSVTMPMGLPKTVRISFSSLQTPDQFIWIKQIF